MVSMNGFHRKIKVDNFAGFRGSAFRGAEAALDSQPFSTNQVLVLQDHIVVWPLRKLLCPMVLHLIRTGIDGMYHSAQLTAKSRRDTNICAIAIKGFTG